MKKTLFYKITIVGVLMGAILFCLILYLHPQHKALKTIKIGVLNVPNDVLFTRQNHELENKLEDMGYKLKFITFDSGVDANKALLANDIQMATMGHTNGVVAMSAKIPAKLVWINDIIGSNEQLVVKESSGIKNWKDLKGKKIATPFASTSHYSLMMYLKRHHIDRNVKLLDMQTTEIVAAWNRGDIDAAYTWQPSLSNIHGKRVLVDSSKLNQQNITTANVTLATDEFIKNNPKELRAILNVLEKGHEQYHKNPTEVFKQTAVRLGVSESETKKQIGTSKWLNRDKQVYFMNNDFIKQFYKSAEFMWEQQTISSPPTEQQCRSFIKTDYI